MYLDKKSILNFCDFIFLFIISFLLINSLVIFSKNIFAGFINEFNKDIFNFSYIVILLITLIKNFLSNRNFYNKKNLILFFFVLLFFIVKFSIDPSLFVAKHFIQIFILFLIYYLLFDLNIKLFYVFITFVNLIVTISIVIYLWQESAFFQTSFFYLYDFNELGMVINKNLYITTYTNFYASQFNHFNLLVFLIFLINIILQTYKKSTFFLFSVVVMFFYILLYSNLYTFITLVVYILLIFFEKIKILN